MTWAAPTFLDNLKTAIDADVTIAALTPAVEVYTCWTAPDLSTTDALMLFAADSEQINAVFGTLRQDENVTFEGELRLIRALEYGTTTELVNKAARDRAKTIIDRLIYLTAQRPAAGTQDLRARVSNVRLDQMPAVIGAAAVGVRMVLVNFTLTATIRTSLS